MNRPYVAGRRSWLHPLQAILLAGMLPLFLGALLSDYAYSQSFEIQWTNFASWLTAGALVFCGLSLLWAVIDLFWPSRRTGRSWLLAVLLLAIFALGFVSVLVHARDAYAAMPGSLICSIILALLALAAVWTGFSRPQQGAAA